MSNKSATKITPAELTSLTDKSEALDVKRLANRRTENQMHAAQIEHEADLATLTKRYRLQPGDNITPEGDIVRKAADA